MEFTGIQIYDINFFINMCFGLLLALPHILFINLLINSLLTRIVLYTYILLFFVPIFALNSWLIGFDFVYIFFYVELFFITVIFGYFYFVYFFQLISSRKNDPSARAIASKKYKTSEGSSGSNIIFFIISGFFAVYFYLINPEHSGMLAYFENRDVLPRFAIYSSSDSFQLIFALYGRVLAPLAIFLAASKRSRIVVVLFALAILLNSVERQTVIICIFSYIVTLFIKQERVGIIDLIILSLLATGLFGVILMQGNVVSSNIFEILPLGFKVIFSRIFIDPLYMLHHILFYYPDMAYTYGATNRLLAFIGLNYIVGYSAIGIIADGHLAFGVFGIIISGIWFSLVLAISSRLAKNSRKSLYGGISSMLLLIACISFFYSNTFSVVPIAIIAIIIIPNLIIKFFGTQR